MSLVYNQPKQKTSSPACITNYIHSILTLQANDLVDWDESMGMPKLFLIIAGVGPFFLVSIIICPQDFRTNNRISKVVWVPFSFGHALKLW